MTKKSKVKIIKISVSIVAVLLVLFLIVPYSVSAIVLHVVFDRRFETEDYLRFSVQDFQGLQTERHTFDSESGQTLVGYRYYTDNISPKGLVVLSHGFGGGGQNGYLDVSDYFVRHGYEVFAYDMTGNDESGGKVRGLERGIIDLNGAIAYAKERFSLPTLLWGHSAGGYASLCALAYNEGITAVASVASFHCASDMLKVQGVKYGGAASEVFLAYVRSVQRMKFGKYAGSCGIDAAKDSTAKVFIAQGTADETVPVEYGYQDYYNEFSPDPRFRFFQAEGKGHTDILYSAEGWAYTLSLQSAVEGCSAEEERREVIKNIDRTKLCSRLNEELFEQIVNFYDECV
ncbi:MAG: alpha/beta fold hydrolase [Clostridia bacterium]|nr:alpha/beta fold hydrolase [Clostridia bacterium]